MAIGARGEISFQLVSPVPIVRVQVKLSGAVVGEIRGEKGDDYRDVSAMQFSVPRAPGDYNITIAAWDSGGCTNETIVLRNLTVF